MNTANIIILKTAEDAMKVNATSVSEKYRPQ